MTEEEQLMQYVWDHWPELHSYVPNNAVPFAGRFVGDVSGLCTHFDVLDAFWLLERGGKRFGTGPPPPDSFLCVATHTRIGLEALYVMWHRAGRRFWLYDEYVQFYSRSSSAPDRTRETLNLALARWEGMSGDVIYSEPWGWLQPRICRFEKDRVGDRIEDRDYDWLASNFEPQELSRSEPNPPSQSEGSTASSVSLQDNLQDPDNDARLAAAEALGEVFPDVRAQVPALTEALRDASSHTRLSAAEALGRIGAQMVLTDMLLPRESVSFLVRSRRKCLTL